MAYGGWFLQLMDCIAWFITDGLRWIVYDGWFLQLVDCVARFITDGLRWMVYDGRFLQRMDCIGWFYDGWITMDDLRRMVFTADGMHWMIL